MTREFITTAPADSTTPQEFFAGIFGDRKQREAKAQELHQARLDCEAAVQSVFKSDAPFLDQMERIRGLRAEHAVRVREIEARYSLAPVHRDTAPDNGNERVAA